MTSSAPSFTTGEFSEPADAAIDAPVNAGNYYAELKRLIIARGLMAPQPVYYVVKILITVALLTAGLAVLILVHNFWLQVLNALYLTFVLGQVAFLAHDTGHRQIIRRGRWYEVLSVVVGNLLLGISARWWTNKHNAHHSHPNQYDMDPDIDIPVIVFSEEQAKDLSGWRRFFCSYQAYTLVPLLFLQAHSMRVMGSLYLLNGHAKRSLVELPLMFLHMAVYFWLLLHALSVGPAIGVFFFTQALFGVYLGSVFAPNHKGMPLVNHNSPLDFFHRQVMTARNVHAHVITDFCFGGLNYQIEHHLFPGMARNKLREAQHVVKEFCLAKGVTYHETSVGRSYREVFGHVHRISLTLRHSASPA